MADSSNNGLGAIRPNEAYHILDIAKFLHTSERWVKDNMINCKDNPCAHKRIGAVIIFKGSWIIDWLDRDFKFSDIA